jgi:hypothetical protein
MYTYNKDRNAKHFCKRCLHCFSNAERLANHLPHCSLDEPTRTILPQKGTMMKFFNYKNMLKVPYVVYADFECILAEVDDDHYKLTNSIF